MSKKGEHKIPKELRAEDFRKQAPGLTAPGQPFSSYFVAEESVGHYVADSSGLQRNLRPHHEHYPLYVCPDLTLYLEAWEHPAPPDYVPQSEASGGWDSSPNAVSEELLRVSEPKCRPDLFHTYELTSDSLHGASSTAMSARHVLALLEKYSKVRGSPPSRLKCLGTKPRRGVIAFLYF